MGEFMLVKWRKTTEREKDIIGLMQGYLGTLIMTSWGMWCLNNNIVPYTLKHGWFP